MSLEKKAFIVRLTPRACPSLLFAALLGCPGLSADALPGPDANWQLREESDGIRIYTTAVPGSDFEAFRAVADLDASTSRLMAVLVNPASCTEWVHNCVESEAFGSGGFGDRYAYSVNDMPWPVQDRDYVIRIRTHGEQASGVVDMYLSAVPGARPERDDYIRVDQSDTHYRFEPLGPERTRLTWVQHTEPNGSIPSWLVNSLVVDIPVKSIRNLERVARSPRYAGYELVFDDAGKLVDVVRSSQSEGDAP